MVLFLLSLSGIQFLNVKSELKFHLSSVLNWFIFLVNSDFSYQSWLNEDAYLYAYVLMKKKGYMLASLWCSVQVHLTCCLRETSPVLSSGHETCNNTLVARWTYYKLLGADIDVTAIARPWPIYRQTIHSRVY